jgi:hypothetical protein
VDRDRWLGFRWQGHGLGGDAGKEALDELLQLGFQGSRLGGAEQSLIQRAKKIGSTSVTKAISPDGPLVTMWSVRGAPHTHRVTQLDFIRDALAPRESDEGGASYVAAVREVASALSAVVKGPTSKGEASRGVADRVSASLVQWCARCKADHVPDGLFRAAGRQAQVVLGPEEQRATMLHPKPKQRQEKVKQPRAELLKTFFRVNGPVSRSQYKDWSDAETAAVGELWDELGDDLVRVQVDGKRYDLPASLMVAVQQAAKPSGVVLVPPNDPYLRQVDRTLLVPDSKRRQQVWKALSGPGALLVDGEMAGVWRYRRSEGDLSITPFANLSLSQRSQAARNAALVAEASDDDKPKVIWS